jgi:hypothetical protein
MFNVRMSNGTSFGPADLEQIVQWARDGRIPRDALLYPVAGGEPKSVFAEPRIAAILSAPPTTANAALDEPKTPVSRLIPTRNQPALWGYYLSVVGLIPGLFLVSPVSLGLGILGVIRAIRTPEAKGLLHAIVAIVLSVVSPLAWWYFFTHFDELMNML